MLFVEYLNEYFLIVGSNCSVIAENKKSESLIGT